MALLPTGCGSDDPTFSKPSGTGGEGGATGGGGGTTTATGGGGGSVEACKGATDCDGVCTQLDFDPANCGACGNACAEGEVCSQGMCGLHCGAGTVQCGDLCVNTDNDPANCGACDTACDSGQVCVNAQCALTCESGGGTNCNGLCVDTATDTKNCGACDTACQSGEVCVAGMCQLECVGGTSNCSGACVDVKTDPTNCGSCGNACGMGEVCSIGVCSFNCIGGTKDCNGLCVDTQVDPKNCGGCGKVCKQDEVCSAGACKSVCGGNLTKCGNNCVDVQTDDANCGACGTACKANEDCKAGTCVACDSNTTDCDGDGWKVADGDCCDVPGSCGQSPELVNPGAIEVVGNGVDDNCNGKADLFDLEDTVPCDSGLASDSTNAGDFAKALGICRTAQANPPLKTKTWGLIEAKILRADGSPLGDNRAKSLRSSFGNIKPGTLEGQRAVVISSGIAADKNQTNPGPNSTASTSHNPSSNVNISTCNDPNCIKDWFTTANPPLKKANELPVAPNCGSGNAGGPNQARDSVMIKLKLRAPTNAKAFSFNSYFLSAEYPEYVCTAYNDQFVVLVDTPTPPPIPNPVDKNLMVYNDGMQQWPVGINIAAGTSLFSVCDSQMDNPGCWDTSVSTKSCFLGSSQLVNTGFGVNSGNCTTGGGTFWLTTAGNVVPGQTVDLRIVIWDVGDTVLDSLAIIDGFKWLSNATLPGTNQN